MNNFTEHLDCCAKPALKVTRRLKEGPRHLQTIETCACGAVWFHAWSEVAVSWDSEVETDSLARLSAGEAASLPDEPTDRHLEALPERRVLMQHTGDERPAWRTGRVPSE